MRSGPCYRLERVPHHDCQNPSPKTYQECGPIDKNYPDRWYVPCRKTGHVGVHLVGGAKGTMTYRLPEGVSCDYCVLQWYWGTGNSCAPRGFLDYFKNYNNPFGTECDSDGGDKGAYRPGMSECTGNSIPEEFWSCADVKISSDGDGDDNQMNSSMIGMPQPLEEESSTIGADGLDEDSDEQPEESPATSDVPVMEFKCVNQEETCDGTKPCCGSRTACVHIPDEGFVCKRLRPL